MNFRRACIWNRGSIPEMLSENIKRKNPTRWKVAMLRHVADEVVVVLIAGESRKERRASAEK